MFWDNLSGRNYHYSLRNNPEQHSPHVLCSGSLKSHIFSTICPTSSHDKKIINISHKELDRKTYEITKDSSDLGSLVTNCTELCTSRSTAISVATFSKASITRKLTLKKFQEQQQNRSQGVTYSTIRHTSVVVTSALLNGTGAHAVNGAATGLTPFSFFYSLFPKS